MTPSIRMLAPAVQIFSNGDNEYRVRRGVWNFEEAVLNIEDASDEIKKAVSIIFEHLGGGQEIDLQRLGELVTLEQEELAQVIDVLESLTADGYLRADGSTANIVHQILGDAHRLDDSLISADQRPLLLYSDSEAVVDYARDLVKGTPIEMDVLSLDEMNEIGSLDLTSRYDVYEDKSDQRRFSSRIEPYSCVVGCLERPRVSFLRNMNRMLISLSKSSVLSMVDGSFTFTMTLKPPETGCFECFETRLRARIEDRTVYSQYVDKVRAVSVAPRSAGNTTLLHGLASAAMQEGILLQKIGRSRLAGRVQSTYLPLLEIQMQDILRVPYCPACGFGSSRSSTAEMYASTSSMADEFKRRVQLLGHDE